MEYWFAIILGIIAVLAIAILIFYEVMGENAVLIKKKHVRGKYVNDQTAVICRTIKDTDDSKVAYNAFMEYMFVNHKQFLQYLHDTLVEISKSYNSDNIEGLKSVIADIAEMKIELKDQRIAQIECINTIDRFVYIEAASWINLANDCRFNINSSLRHIAEVCIEYAEAYSEPFPDPYTEQLGSLVQDICNCCNIGMELTGTNDIQEMRQFRKDMSVMLDESYTNSGRLFELIHDGRSELDEYKVVALKYALNAFHELHGIIYALRRFVLANICLTLSLR